MGFINDPEMGGIFVLMIASLMLIPAFLTLTIGLALRGYQRWRRDTGIVLLSAAALTALFVLFWITMISSKEMRDLMPPETVKRLSGYTTGGSMLAGIAGTGWLLILSSKKQVDQDARSGETQPVTASVHGTLGAE